MPPLRNSLSGALAVFAAAVAARAELIKVSPFLPSATAAATPTANAPLEFRGTMEIGTVEQYRIVDPARKIGNWLKVGERDPNLDVTIKQHDKDRETITIDHGGQTMTLSLHEAKVASGGGVPMMAPPVAAAPMPNVSPAVVNTVVPNPTPADEQRRLEAVAAEVARRRALREQAAQGIQPSGQIATPAVTRQDLQQAQQMRPPQNRQP